MKLLPLIVLLLLASGCSIINNGGVKAYDKYVGTDGVTIAFVKNSPPEKLYEDRVFPVTVELHNAGAMNLSIDRMMVTFSTDPLYITRGKTQSPAEQSSALLGTSDISPLFPRDIISSKEILGRSELYPTGERKALSAPSDNPFRTKPVFGQRESPETELTASVCFAYTTFASASVCIDTNTYQENLRTQGCKQENVVLTGGQGAPIAVTQIDVEAMPQINDDGTESVRPQFMIHIEDVGKGHLIGPDKYRLEDACLLRKIPREEVSTVKIEAALFKTPLVCAGSKDGIVKIVDGKAEVSCTVPDDRLGDAIYASAQNFQSILTINLSYLYKTSATTKVTIQRVVQAGNEQPRDTEDVPITGYMYKDGKILRDNDGYAVTQCAYYALSPEEAPAVLRDAIERNTPKQLSCACTMERCLQLGRDSQCVIGYCAAGLQCCTDPPKRSAAAEAGAVVIGEQSPTGLGTTGGSMPSLGSNPSKQQINDALEAAANAYGIPGDVLKSVAYQESRWNPQVAVGDGGKSFGLMQINTKWHPRYDVALGKKDLAYNINYGAWYLASLYKQSGDWRTAVRRYNGSGAQAEAYATTVMANSQSRPWVAAFKVN